MWAPGNSRFDSHAGEGNHQGRIGFHRSGNCLHRQQVERNAFHVAID
jgi:hypothetical protein